MDSKKVSDSQLETIKGLMAKGFANVEENFAKIDENFVKIEERFDKVEARIDSVEKNLTKEIDDLAGMTEREFKAVRSEMAVRTFKSNLKF